MNEQIKKVEVPTPVISKQKVTLIKTWDISKSILIVLGVIILILIGIYGVIKITPKAVSSLASVFISSSTSKPAEKIEIFSSAENIISGEEFILSWKHISKSGESELYSYFISYGCKNDVYIKLQSNNPSNSNLPCGKIIKLENKENSVIFMAISEKEKNVELPLSIFYIKNGTDDIVVKADTNLNIVNRNISDNTQINTNNSNSINTKNADNVNNNSNVATVATVATVTGKPDLSVKILATGILNKLTGQFIATNNINYGDRFAIKFKISNIGNKASGSWAFNALLPTSEQKVFNSEQQISLAPGDKIEFTLGFDNALAGQNSILISIDEANTLGESQRDNNSTTATFYINGTNLYNPYNNNLYNNIYDLSVKIIDTGIMDSYNQFVSTTNIYPRQKVAVKFEVTNIGIRESSQYIVKATSLASNNNLYTSEYKPSLLPNQKMIYTLAFDNFYPNNYNNNYYNNYNNNYYNNYLNDTITVSIEPNNSISSIYELRKDNNTASTIIKTY